MQSPANLDKALLQGLGSQTANIDGMAKLTDNLIEPQATKKISQIKLNFISLKWGVCVCIELSGDDACVVPIWVWVATLNGFVDNRDCLV